MLRKCRLQNGSIFYTLRPLRNSGNFADGIFKYIFFVKCINYSPKLVFWAPMYSDVMNCCVRAVLPTPRAPNISTLCILASPLEEQPLQPGDPPAEFNDEVLDREHHSFRVSRSDPTLPAPMGDAPNLDINQSPSFTIPFGVILKDRRRYAMPGMGSSGMFAISADRSGGMSLSTSSNVGGVGSVGVPLLSSESEPTSDWPQGLSVPLAGTVGGEIDTRMLCLHVTSRASTQAAENLRGCLKAGGGQGKLSSSLRSSDDLHCPLESFGSNGRKIWVGAKLFDRGRRLSIGIGGLEHVLELFDPGRDAAKACRRIDPNRLPPPVARAWNSSNSSSNWLLARLPLFWESVMLRLLRDPRLPVRISSSDVISNAYNMTYPLMCTSTIYKIYPVCSMILIFIQYLKLKQSCLGNSVLFSFSNNRRSRVAVWPFCYDDTFIWT